jgi:plastocyanin
MSSLRLVLAMTTLAIATACGGYSTPSPSPAPAPAPTPTPSGPSSSVQIPVGAETLGNRAFTPDTLEISPGSTVTWTNTDATSHTTTSDGALWASGTLAPGRQFSFTFQTTGTFAYHCSIHPGMVGTIVVR